MSIEGWVALAGILASAWGVVHTIRRNHELSLALQKANFRQQVNLDLFREIRPVISNVISDTSRADTTVRLLPGNISRYWTIRAQTDFEPSPIYERSQQLLDERSQADESLMKLASLLSSHSLAVPAFKTFAQVLHDQMERIRESHSKWFSEMLKWLPVEVVRTLPNGAKYVETHPRHVPSAEDIRRIQELTDEHLERCGDMSGYVYDIGIEAENLLVGTLYGRSKLSRKPLDSRIPVLDSKPETLEMYDQHFEKKQEEHLKRIFSEYDLDKLKLTGKAVENA